MRTVPAHRLQRRKGPGYTNLFTGLARCAYCKSTIAFENKGSGTRGGSYLICGDAQRGLGCEATRWRYKDFETSFLAFVEELDLQSIINSNEDAQKRKRLEDECAAISGELSSVKQLMEKTYEVLSTGGSTEFVSGSLGENEYYADSNAVRFAESKDEIRDFLSTRMGRLDEDKMRRFWVLIPEQAARRFRDDAAHPFRLIVARHSD